jgi:hypothetical protein
MLTWLDSGIKVINRSNSGKKINNLVGHAILGWEWEGTVLSGGVGYWSQEWGGVGNNRIP